MERILRLREEVMYYLRDEDFWSSNSGETFYDAVVDDKGNEFFLTQLSNFWKIGILNINMNGLISRMTATKESRRFYLWH